MIRRTEPDVARRLLIRSDIENKDGVIRYDGFDECRFFSDLVRFGIRLRRGMRKVEMSSSIWPSLEN